MARRHAGQTPLRLSAGGEKAKCQVCNQSQYRDVEEIDMLKSSAEEQGP
jgi:hypothetical protein